MKVLNFKSHVTSTCPCGQVIEVGDVDEVPCVIHVRPHCKKFEELELVDYLHWVNVMQGNHN